MATVKLKEIATDITWGDATRDINENNRKIQVALATVASGTDGNASWGESTTESAELIIGGSGTKVVSLDGHTHETSEVNGLDAKLAQTDASIDSLNSSDTAIKGQISGVKASISDLYNKVQDVDEGGVKKTELKTLTVNVNGTKVGEYDTKSDKTINITADMLGLSGAMAFRGVTVTEISTGSTDNQVDMEDGTFLEAKKGDVVIYGNKEFVWVGSKWQELGDEQSFALKSITVTGTGYLTGGGNLEANRTIDIATSVKTKIDNGDAALTKANALESNLANNYPTKNGTGASGTWGVDISGKAASADKVANSLTFNSSGAGAASGSTYDGSATKTISYNTIGAAKAVHSHAFSEITGKPTTLGGYGITDGVSDAELSAHASNTDIHLADGDRGNIEAALVMASDASSELAVVLEGYEATPVLKTELGKKANVSDLTAHTGNTTIHITASERSSWNAKYSKPATGIPVDDMEAGVAESLANADLALADVGALSQNFIAHESDTTVHITANERKAWNAKADASTLNSHTGNTEIHTTSAEKASWNNKYDKPSTGIPITDLESGIQESIGNADAALENSTNALAQISYHEDDMVKHITAEERSAWNGKANTSDLNAHTGNSTIHITSAERSKWNAKYDKPSTGIPIEDLESGIAESLGNADLALADVGALSQNFINHEGDTTVHITASERTAWNGKADASTLNSHTSNTAIHTTAEEKASWNGKYTKPETGIPAEDLDESVKADINSGAMSYEMASEANGKVSLLLGSYGAEIPDLKNELGKKQDKLVSGTSIKTVNGESLLGKGNITTPKTTVVDNLTSTSGTDALSANQGKVLNEKFADVVTQADVVNSLGSTEQKKPLSAFMGKVLSDRLNNGDFIAKEAKMQWGGRNNNDQNLSPVEALLIERPSRTIFGNAEGVKVEYSTNGGSTWNAYTDNSNYGLLLRPYNVTPFSLGGSSDRGKSTTDMLRITLNAKGIGVYLGNIRKIYFYGGQTNARSLKVVLESRKAVGGVSGGGDNEFEVVQTLDSFSAWPGWGFLSVNDSGFGTWSHSETYNNNNIIEYRLTFSINNLYTTDYDAPYIARVGIYSTGIYESLEYAQMYGNPLVLHDDGYIHADRELYLTKRVQAQNIQVSNLNVLSSMTIKPSIKVEGVLTVNSKIAGGGNIEASGQLIIDGDATLKSNATVSGDLSVGGTLNYTRARVETSEASVTLDASKYTVINCSGELTINLPNGYATDGKEYVCEIRTGSIGPTVSFPADIKFAFGDNFVSGFQPDSVYQISIQNSLAVVIPFV